MRVYLDTCCFNRPYDDQEQEKIFLETEAKLSIQEKIKKLEIELVWSYILDYENYENPNEIIRSAIYEWRKICISDISESDELLLRAEKINKIGIDAKDAIHISCAIEAGADIFFTTDRKILKHKHLIPEIEILNPVQYFIELE
jgi:predicted nucleic acid-binding protein